MITKMRSVRGFILSRTTSLSRNGYPSYNTAQSTTLIKNMNFFTSYYVKVQYLWSTKRSHRIIHYMQYYVILILILI